MGNNNSYKIIKKIGKSNYEVYLAQKDNKNYAIKKIHNSNFSENEKQSVQKLLEVLKNINHPNIVKYYDSFDDENDYFNIVMEYGGESNLKQFIKKYKDRGELIDQKLISDIILHICLGLQEIHGHKIIHRDLTPDNIFINENNKIKIGDFGVSKMLSTHKKYAKSYAGKLHYNAPEIETNEKYDYKVDIYSLGCIMYELFTLNEYYIDKIIDEKDGRINGIYEQKYQDLIDSCLSKQSKNRLDIGKIINKLLLDKINVIFSYEGKKNLVIVLDNNITVEEMIESYFHRIGKPELIGNDNFIFLFNTSDLRSDEYKNKTIRELGYSRSILISILINAFQKGY